MSLVMDMLLLSRLLLLTQKHKVTGQHDGNVGPAATPGSVRRVRLEHGADKIFVVRIPRRTEEKETQRHES